MNLSTYKLCVQLLRCSKTKSNLLLPVNNAQKMLITRSVLTRPKEMDEFRKQRKERDDENGYKYEQHKSDPSEEIGLYGYFLLV